MITYLKRQEPNWKPFEQVVEFATPETIKKAKNCGSSFICDFMFMGAVTDSYAPGKQINLYKHCDTRRYLNIDDDGKCYSYESNDPGKDGVSESFYQPQEIQTALFLALS